MKIDGTTPAYQQIIQSTSPQRQTAPERVQTSKEATDAFSVTLSDTVAKLQATAPQEMEVRPEKVAAIRDQLSNGTYSISGKDVAAKIINLLNE